MVVKKIRSNNNRKKERYKLTKEDNYLYYRSGEKWEMVMALLLGGGVCLTRLATAASQILLALATVLALFLWWRNGRRLQLSNISLRYIKVSYLFFFATLLSIIDVDNRLYVLQNFFGTWVWRFMVFIFIVAFVKKREYLLKILAAFFVVYCLDCFTACYQFLVMHWQRGRGFHGDYLDLAAIICMVLIMSAVIVLDSNFERWIKRFALLGIAFSIAGLFCCFSRGAFLVSAMVAPLYLFFYIKRSKKVAVICLSILILIAAPILCSPKYTARLSTTLNTTTNISNVDRIRAWKSSVNMFLDYPVNGVGLNNWNRYYRSQYQLPEEKQNLPHAHSNYMQLLGETGIIGFGAFLYFIGYFLFTSAKRWLKNHNPCDLIFFVAFLATIVLFGAFQPTYRLSSVIRTLWFILAIMIQLHDKSTMLDS